MYSTLQQYSAKKLSNFSSQFYCLSTAVLLSTYFSIVLLGLYIHVHVLTEDHSTCTTMYMLYVTVYLAFFCTTLYRTCTCTCITKYMYMYMYMQNNTLGWNLYAVFPTLN